VGGFTARMQPLTLPGRGESSKIEPRDSDGGRMSRQADRQESRSPSRRVQRAGLAFQEGSKLGHDPQYATRDPRRAIGVLECRKRRRWRPSSHVSPSIGCHNTAASAHVLDSQSLCGTHILCHVAEGSRAKPPPHHAHLAAL
jgi:hypothetical protein